MTYEVNEMKIPSQVRKRVRTTKYLVSLQEKIVTNLNNKQLFYQEEIFQES